MAAASLVLGLLGVALTFAAEEWCIQFEINPTVELVSILQVLGAFMIGFAALNWLSKGMLLGGIYGRPTVLSNLVQFLMSALIFGKLATKYDAPSLWLLTLVFGLLAMAFSAMLFKTPDEM
mgnify:CR=1 FL=1